MNCSFVRLIQRLAVLVMLAASATAIASPAATKFKSLISFDDTDGLNGVGSVVQGLDGNLYGITEYGGAHPPYGTIFKITPGGKLTTLYSFCSQSNCTDGAYPAAALLLVANGNFYGTTTGGGAAGLGSIFEITPAGKLTTLYSFCHGTNCPDGFDPNSALIQGTDGNFYGTTVHGGTGGCGGCHGGGVAFKITPGGTYTKLHDFCTGTCLDGTYPFAGLVQGTDGNFYGTAESGGAHSAGTVFKMTPKGVVTTLYAFCSVTACKDGINPYAGLVQATDGNLYGTTEGDDSTAGSAFKITPSGSFTSIYSFCSLASCTDGAYPFTALIQATDGNLYGTTSNGGTGCEGRCGTVYKITPAGKLTVVYNFQGTDGTNPAGLFQDTSGTFYGLTSAGGATNQGTVFSLSVGLKPFVELLPDYGKVGDTIDILGQGFTGATGVSFDGVAATFNNASDTYMTATVPTGALTGIVTVTTFTTSYKSSEIFRVRPQIRNFAPISGAVGIKVEINGVSLTQTANVTIGGKAATFKVINDSEVSAIVPGGAKNGQKICITTAGGTVCSAGTFTVEPKIISFSPTSGPVGTLVTIKGTTFTGTTKVTFGGGVATSFQVINDSEVQALVPGTAKTGKIQATTPGGTATSATNFTVT